MPADNERFGATAAGRADLKGSAKNRRCAKPPSRWAQAADSVWGYSGGLFSFRLDSSREANIKTSVMKFDK